MSESDQQIESEAAAGVIFKALGIHLGCECGRKIGATDVGCPRCRKFREFQEAYDGLAEGDRAELLGLVARSRS